MDERIIERIKKILALAENNPSQAEAEAAMLKAQELLVANGLTMAEVGEIKTEQNVVEESFYVAKVVEQWMGALMNVVTEQTRCKAFWNRTTNLLKMNSFRHTAVFVGTEQDAAVAAAMYQYSFGVIKELSRKYAKERGGNSKKMMASYSLGFVMALKGAYEKQVADNKWGLVLIPSEKVVAKFEEHNLKMLKARDRDEDYGAYVKGHRDGEGFNMNGAEKTLGEAV